jgi:ABC-type transporter Mla MlaB component
LNVDVAAEGRWSLPERVTLDTVAALYRARCEQPAAIRCFDLNQVQEIDSAGVAMLHWFRSRQRQLGLTPAPIEGAVAERYQALCRAHRVEEDELS